MNPTKALTRIPNPPCCSRTRISAPNNKWIINLHSLSRAKFPVNLCSRTANTHLPSIDTTAPSIASDVSSGVSHNLEQGKLDKTEESIEKFIYSCRFFAILAVWGSLIGSFLCFFKGCIYVLSAFQDYFVDRAKVIASLVEATDVYLLGTVMLVFGMGLYELFISNFDKAKSTSEGIAAYQSNLFGLFMLKERPRWLEINTVNELKTKVGHVIVMLLLIGLFDKSKKAVINSPLDLLCFSASVLLSSGSLYLLSKLN